MHSADGGVGNVSAILVMNQTTNATSSLKSPTESTTVEELEMRGTSMFLYVVAILIIAVIVLFGTVDFAVLAFVRQMQAKEGM
jgi:hypothetical protein